MLGPPFGLAPLDTIPMIPRLLVENALLIAHLAPAGPVVIPTDLMVVGPGPLVRVPRVVARPLAWRLSC